jgi:ankyrin repeat protein
MSSLSSLKEAIESGDLAGVRAAIKADPKGAKHAQFVMKAAHHAFLPALKLLHKNGSDLNVSYCNNRPLGSVIQPHHHHGAGKIEAERLECLEWMLANGADTELLAGWPPSRAIILAGISGAAEYVKAVKKAGAKIDAFAAAALGDLKLVEKTLKSKPEFALEQDENGLTALGYAAASRLQKTKTYEVAEMLLDSGADANATFKSSLGVTHLASRAGNKAIFKLLLERGADPLNALSHAVWHKRYELAEISLAHGAELDRATSNGRPLVNDLIRWGLVNEAKWVLEQGASPDLEDEDGWTAAHQAARRGNAQMMQAVIDAGADLSVRDKKRQTPIEVARAAGRDKVVGLLSGF